MCLNIQHEHEQKILDCKFKKRFKNGKLVVWKTISKKNGSIHKNYLWKFGLNISDRKTLELTNDEKRTNRINHGFHVYVNRNAARQNNRVWGDGNRKIVRLIANIKDFVAVGDSQDAVFTKLTYPKQ